jgi:hypothetical protein
MPIIFNDRVTNGDAFVTNVGAWVVTGGGDELTDNVLAFVTERTAEGIVCCALQAKSPNDGRTTYGPSDLTGRNFSSSITALAGLRDVLAQENSEAGIRHFTLREQPKKVASIGVEAPGI